MNDKRRIKYTMLYSYTETISDKSNGRNKKHPNAEECNARIKRQCGSTRNISITSHESNSLICDNLFQLSSKN